MVNPVRRVIDKFSLEKSRWRNLMQVAAGNLMQVAAGSKTGGGVQAGEIIEISHGSKQLL